MSKFAKKLEPKIKFKTIAWIAFRELFEELREFTIDEKTEGLFYKKFEDIVNMNLNDKINLLSKWNNRPYVYNGNLNNYEKDIKIYK